MGRRNSYASRNNEKKLDCHRHYRKSCPIGENNMTMITKLFTLGMLPGLICVQWSPCVSLLNSVVVKLILWQTIHHRDITILYVLHSFMPLDLNMLVSHYPVRLYLALLYIFELVLYIVSSVFKYEMSLTTCTMHVVNLNATFSRKKLETRCKYSPIFSYSDSL